MTTAALLSVASSICAALFAIIIALLAWMGNKLYNKMEQMGVENTQSTGLFFNEINKMDIRLTVVETECRAHHQGRRSGDN